MDEKNKNISDTFGKYNNNAGQVQNVSSSMWEPISAGRTGSQPAGQTKRPQPKSSAAKNPKAGKTTSSAKKKKAAPQGENLISQGKPVSEKGRKTAKKPGGKTAGNSKAAQNKKAPPSRTPTGRDMRKDAREQQKHREELFRFREDYKRQIKNQLNHDEISHVRNQNKRKKLVMKNAVTVGSVVLFALIFILIYCYSRGALIENVKIYGDSIYTAEEIQLAAGISKGKNMLSLRESKVRRDITKKLPYINYVEMEYDLPDTLILTIRGTSDKYFIAGQNGGFTLDGDRKVVSTGEAESKSGLFRAEGFDYQNFEAGDVYKPEGLNELRFTLLEEFVTYFEQSGIVDSAVINLTNTEDVVVTVDGKIAVYFGDCKELEEKVPYASGIIEQVRAAGKKGYIDMRFDLGYFKPGSMTIQ